MSPLQHSILLRLSRESIELESDGRAINNGKRISRRTIESMAKAGLIWLLSDRLVISDLGQTFVEQYRRERVLERRRDAKSDKLQKARDQIVSAVSRLCVTLGGPPFVKWGKPGVTASVIDDDFGDPLDVIIQIDTWGNDATVIAESLQELLDGWRGPLLGFNYAAIACMSLPKQLGTYRTISEWRLAAGDEPIGELGFGSVFERFDRTIWRSISEKLDELNDQDRE